MKSQTPAHHEARDIADATILKREAARLNREAADVLDYQDLPSELAALARSAEALSHD